MTVAKIKEYIDEQKTRLEKIEVNLSNRDMQTMLSEIKYMLDELEQPIEIDTKKYFETMDKIIAKEIKRSKS